MFFSENEALDALSRLYEDHLPNVTSPDALEPTALSGMESSTWYDHKFETFQKHPESLPDRKIVDGALYYRRPDPLKATLGDRIEWKQVVKADQVLDIIQSHYDEVSVGHLGIEKAYYRVSTSYYWPGMLNTRY